MGKKNLVTNGLFSVQTLFTLVITMGVGPFSMATSTATPEVVSKEALSPRLAEQEAMWRLTEINYRNLDGSLNEKYCAKEARFLLACLTGLEALAQLTDPQAVLQLNGQKIVFAKDPTIKEPQSNADVKKHYRDLRARFHGWQKRLEALSRPALAMQVQALFSQLEAKHPHPQPYEVAQVLNAVTGALYDPQTMYLPSTRYNSLRVSDKNFVVGIRFERKGSALQIEDVVRGLPAEAAGLQPGDQILAIDSLPVEKMGAAELDRAMTRNNGEEIRLKVQRNATAFDVLLAFVPAETPTLVARSLQPSFLHAKALDYLAVSTYADEDICEHTAVLLATLERNDHSGLLLDLRGNPGGFTDQGKCLLSHFLGPNRVIMHEVNLIDPGIRSIVKTDRPQIYTKPITVLVDAETASAAETTAQSLKAYGRALIVGQQTFGKATQQYELPLGRITYHATEEIYFDADGSSHGGSGMRPQFVSFRNPTPAPDEIDVLHDEDLGIQPIVPPKIEFPKLDARPLYASQFQGCLEQAKVQSTYLDLGPTHWERDLQILTGAALVACQK